MDSFSQYSWFDPSWTLYLLGGVLTIVIALSIFKGTCRLTYVTGLLVPIMALIYLAVGLIVVIFNHQNIPSMFLQIFGQAFDPRVVFSGFTDSTMMYGIKCSLYSDKAGVGSAPNAAVTALVSHPVRQSLVQMLSVFIDTMVVCTITAFITLSPGVQGGEDLKGAPLVTQSTVTIFSDFVLPFVNFTLLLFAFTTIIDGFYYAKVNLRFLVGSHPTPIWALQVFRSLTAVLVSMDGLLGFSVAWNFGDVLMDIMALINLPITIILDKKTLGAAGDYITQCKAGKNPEFRATPIGITSMLDYWR